MKLARILTVLALSATLGLSATATATAGTGSSPAPRATENTGSEDAADRARTAKARKGPIMATYKGKKFDMADGWGDAKVCSEYPDLTVKCFATDAEAQADIAAYAKKDPRALPKAPKGRSAKIQPAAPASMASTASGDGAVPLAASCAFGWTCLGEHQNLGGRKLQWSANGTKTLATWGFRDEATSTCNNDETGGMGIVDYRTNWPDPELITILGTCVTSLHEESYPAWLGAGTWNDRADELWM
ncbi:hypothetical protein PUR57_03695 [Streptomyces sp. JV176]|uniref:hypothetical protein n=1 Tax=Streptomyces sp. JV176 TaxID=858630 RepID=UPI002E77397C|nr:hypothetical protein [Streptomyces sp. JV176]MEE1797788.1 hypothetical protein [Streptomyces sp. JV176]